MADVSLHSLHQQNALSFCDRFEGKQQWLNRQIGCLLEVGRVGDMLKYLTIGIIPCPLSDRTLNAQHLMGQYLGPTDPGCHRHPDTLY